jgi:hypothetical protein
MAVIPEQGPLSFTPMALAATTVNSTNPNIFAVSVQITGGTVTSVSVNNTVAGTSGGVYTVPGGGTFKATYTGSPTLTTSVAPAATYPFTSAAMQNYTAQQNLIYGVGPTLPGGEDT